MVTEERPDNQSIYKKFFLICGIFLVLLLAVEICSSLFLQEKNIPDSAWSINLNGKEIKATSGSLLPHDMKQGDILTCTAIIPDCGFAYPALVFEATRGQVVVTNAGNELYSSKHMLEKDPSRALMNQVSLTTADLSQPVSISIIADESNSLFSVPNFTLVEQRNGFSSFIKARCITFVIALFLFFLGVIGTVICSASRFLGKKLMPLITISQFTLWASLCTFCHLGFILVFIPNQTINSILELVSLYLALFFICLIVYPKLKPTKKQEGRFKKLEIGYLAVCGISLLLPLFTSLSIMDTFSFMLILLFAVIAGMLFMSIRHWIKQPESWSFPVAGLFVLSVYAIVEELRILLNAAGLSVLGTPEMCILSFGIIAFTVCSLIDYFTWFMNSTIQETVEESWKRFKQPNSKPGISGFQKTMALLQELQESDTQYTIITISIDNIEELNLCPIPYLTLEDNFARLVHTVFSSYGITGNLGQGKFLVALADIPEGKVKQLLRAFKELVKRDNENHPEGTIIFSTGYANSTDTEDAEVTKICQLANNSRIAEEKKLIR